MTVSEFLKKLDKIPDDAEIYIADTNLTSWPIQISINKIEFQRKQINLFTSETQSTLPVNITEQIVYS